jgi:hypothetical protein
MIGCRHKRGVLIAFGTHFHGTHYHGMKQHTVVVSYEYLTNYSITSI